MKTRQLSGISYILIAAVLYAVMPVLVRLLGREIPPFSQVFFRYIVAASVALGFGVWQKTSLKAKSNRDLLILTLLGIFCYGFMNAAYTFAFLNTSLANASFLLFTFSVMTPFLGVILLNEKINKLLGFAIVIVAVGLYFMFQPTFGTSDMIGMGFALLSGFLYSLYMIGRRFLKGYSAAFVMLYSTVFGALGVGLISLISESGFYLGDIDQSIAMVSPMTWLVVVLFGIDNFLAWYFVNRGLESVQAGIGSIVLLAELLIVPLLGFLVYSEIPAFFTFVGATFIFTGAVLAAKSSSK